MRTVAVEWCHHGDAASSISNFIAFAVTDLLTKLENSYFQHTTFSFLLWSSILLRSIRAGNFLLAQLAEGTHSTSSRVYQEPSTFFKLLPCVKVLHFGKK